MTNTSYHCRIKTFTILPCYLFLYCHIIHLFTKILNHPLFRDSWKAIPTYTEQAACMVAWRDNLIVFGGQSNKLAVQRYSTVTSKLAFHVNND